MDMYLHCVNVECTSPNTSLHIVQIHCKYRLLSQYIVTSFHTVQYSINTGVVLYRATYNYFSMLSTTFGVHKFAHKGLYIHAYMHVRTCKTIISMFG